MTRYVCLIAGILLGSNILKYVLNMWKYFRGETLILKKLFITLQLAVLP